MSGLVYISGPMSGYEDFNCPAFDRAEAKLRKRGWRTINPADHGIVPDWSWGDYLRLDIRELSYCDSIYMLNGWASSKGARLERHIAKELGMTVYYESEEA